MTGGDVIATASTMAEQFYERSMRRPDIVWIGASEWDALQVDSEGAHSFEIFYCGGSVDLVPVLEVWSMIAPALRSRP